MPEVTYSRSRDGWRLQPMYTDRPNPFRHVGDIMYLLSALSYLCGCWEHFVLKLRVVYPCRNATVSDARWQRAHSSPTD
jgi:hypothetical protein